MKTIALSIVGVLAVSLITSEISARGGGGRGGGGGGSRGGGGGASRGGGGYSRPSASRSPSVSRPSSRPASRPSTSRPSTRPSTRPAAGSRPSTGGRPSAGSRPSKGQLNNFLDISGPSTGRPGTGAAAGGSAAAFLKNSDSGKRPAAGQAAKQPGRRPGTDPVRTRPGEGRAGNRPDRVTNRGERQGQRNSRRDEVRNQVKDNHPRADFWKDNPNAARRRWNRPYRWATWGAIGGWLGWAGDPIGYDYGSNVYYEDDQVYYGEDAVATGEEYADQAQTIAESAPAVDDSADWLPLGVFAVTKDGEKSGPPPTMFVQLTVNKQGIIAGTLQNKTTDKSQPIEGMVDKKTQRTAWSIVGKQWPIMETGISNLTKDTAPALVHFEDGQTQQWLLVRLEEPKEDTAGQ
jgi:hypothetical protein